nr:uncharacterized protein LOC113825212 [Penaeus vannamei]
MACDRADCLKSYYEIDRKARKWWHPIFFHFLDVAVVNSMVLYKMLDEVLTMNLKQFKISLCTRLIGAAGIDSKSPASSDVPRKTVNESESFLKGSGLEKLNICQLLAKHTDAATIAAQKHTEHRGYAQHVTFLFVTEARGTVLLLFTNDVINSDLR